MEQQNRRSVFRTGFTVKDIDAIDFHRVVMHGDVVAERRRAKDDPNCDGVKAQRSNVIKTVDHDKSPEGISELQSGRTYRACELTRMQLAVAFYARKKANSSSFTRCFKVVHMPCGAPL